MSRTFAHAQLIVGRVRFSSVTLNNLVVERIISALLRVCVNQVLIQGVSNHTWLSEGAGGSRASFRGCFGAEPSCLVLLSLEDEALSARILLVKVTCTCSAVVLYQQIFCLCEFRLVSS